MKLEANGVAFSYGARTILDDVSFSVSSGSSLALLGRNGSGKTTLLKLLLGSLQPEKGSVAIDGAEISLMKKKDRAKYIGYIPQFSSSAYPFSALDAVLMGAASSLSLFERPSKKDEERALMLLESLSISYLKKRSINMISGGERQLVMIARALMQDASVLLLDEPTSSLDYSNKLLVMEKLESLRDNGYIIIFSTHDPEEALASSSRVLALSAGKVDYFGPPDGLLDGKVLGDLYSRKLYIDKISTGENERIICVPR